MGAPQLMTLGGAADAPVGHFRAAMLATAMALLALFPLFLLDHPPPIHQVSIDLGELLRDRRGLPDHRLDIGAHGGILLDGAPRGDLVELRMGLDLITLDPEAGLELRPHPELRYETFLEVLAVTRRANVRHLRVVDEGRAAPAASDRAAGAREGLRRRR